MKCILENSFNCEEPNPFGCRFLITDYFRSVSLRQEEWNLRRGWHVWSSRRHCKEKENEGHSQQRTQPCLWWWCLHLQESDPPWTGLSPLCCLRGVWEDDWSQSRPYCRAKTRLQTHSSQEWVGTASPDAISLCSCHCERLRSWGVFWHRRCSLQSNCISVCSREESKTPWTSWNQWWWRSNRESSLRESLLQFNPKSRFGLWV